MSQGVPGVQAAAGINQTINFQGRLLNSNGAVVPDGNYNMQFKVYQDGTGAATGDPGGTLKWTETWLNNNTQGVVVKNGYFSVSLGSVNTTLGSSVDFNQDTLWLSVNIGNTNTTCTDMTAGQCNGDGEMVPMRRLSSAAYAMNAGKLGGLTSGQFVQLAQGTAQTDSTTNASIFLNKTGASGNLITLQKNTTDIFDVDNTGNVLFGNNADKAISVAQAAAGTAGNSLAVKAGTGGTGTGAAGGTLTLQGGDGNGTTANGGNVRIYGGSKGTSGNAGNVELAFDGGSAVGNVGVRKAASTTYALDVNGATNVAGAVTVAPTANSAVGVTITATTGTAAQALVVNQGQAGATTAEVNSTNTSATQANGLLVNRNGAGGTTTNGINITNTAGTLTNGLAFTGTIGTDIQRSSGILTMQGAGGVSVTTPNIAGTTGSITIQSGNPSNANTGAGSISIDTGLPTGIGVGAIALGTSNATQITVGAASTGTITVGQGTATNTINIGSVNRTSATQTINIGNGTSATSGGVSVQLANGTPGTSTTNTVAIGTGGSTTGTVGVTIGSLAAAGHTTTLQGGNGAGAISLQTATNGTIGIGTNNTANTIQVGSTTLNSGTQTIAVGNNNTSGGTTNITIGTGTSATGGSTTIQAKGTTTLMGATAVIKPTAGNDSATAIQMQNAAGISVVTVDTTANTTTNLIDTAGVCGATPTCGGFESGFGNWALTDDGTPSAVAALTTTSSQSVYGSKALDFNANSTGDKIKLPITLSSNSYYSLNFYAKADLTASQVLRAGYSQNGSTEDVAGLSIIDQAVGNGGWYHYQVSIATGTVSGSPYLYFKQNSGTARHIYLDNIELDQVTVNTQQGISAYRAGNISLNGTITTPLTVAPPSNMSALEVLDPTTGGAIFNVDTKNGLVAVGTLSAGSKFQVLASAPSSTASYSAIRGGANALDASTGGSNTLNLLTLYNSALSTNDLLTVTNNGTLNTLDQNIGSASNRSKTRVFSDGFESGNAQLWSSGAVTGGSSTVTFDTTTVRNGKYSMKATNSNGSSVVRTSINGTTTMTAREYVYVTSQTTGDLDLMYFVAGVNNFGLSRDSATGKLAFWNNAIPSGTVGSTVLTTGAWHEIEMNVTFNATTGSVTAYLDGVSVLSLTNQNTGSAAPDSFYVGDNEVGRASVVNYDDVVVDTVRPGESASLNVADSLHVSGTTTLGQTALLPGSDSSVAFLVQNAAAQSVLGVNTSNGTVALGKVGTGGINGKLVLNTTSASNYTSSIGVSSSQLASWDYVLPVQSTITAGNCLTAGSVASSTVNLAFASCGGAGSVRLDQVQAATTTATIGNAANAINWNWQFSGAGTGLSIGETAASTGGSNNQFLLQSTTASGSTASPLKVTSGGTGNIAFNLASTGDLVVQDNGTTTASFNDDGTVSFTNTAINTSGQSQLSATATFNPTAGGTQTGLAQTITNSPTTTANTAIGHSLSISDSTALANTLQGLKLTLSDTGSAGKTVQGLVVDLSGSTNSSGSQKATGLLVKGAANTTTGVTNLLMDLQDSAGTDLFKVANTGATTLAAKNFNGNGNGDTTLTVTGGTPLSNNQGGVGLSVAGGAGGSTANLLGGQGGDALRATGGNGGNGTGTGSSQTGGQGGAVTLAGGNGGTSANFTGGQGGSISLTGGGGGISTSGAGGSGGNLVLTAGNGATGGSSNGTAGAITLTAGLNGGSTARGQVKAVGDLIAASTLASTTAFQVQDTSANGILTVDTTTTSGGRVSVGSIGTATGQLYVAGRVPTAALNTTSTGATTSPRGMAIQGRYLYIVKNGTSGNGLGIYDVSNPASPTAKGTTTFASSAPRQVAVQGHYAYVTNGGTNQMVVIDVSNPNAPVNNGTVTVGTAPEGIAVSGKYAYVANSGANTISVVDISNPLSPSVATTFTITSSTPWGLAIQGKYLYVADQGNDKLQIVDISTPSSPSLAGGVTTGATSDPYAVAVQGRYAYVVNNTSNVFNIFDVSTPTAPAQTATVTISGTPNPTNIVVQGRYAYIARGSDDQMSIYDVSNPAATPVSLGTVATGTTPVGIVVQGRYAYVSNRAGNSFSTYDLGGAYTQQLEAGGLETGTLAVNGWTSLNGDANIMGGLQIGQSLQVANGTSIYGAMVVNSTTNAVVFNQTAGSGSFTVNNSSTPALQVNSAGDVYLGKQDAGRFVFIGTGVSGNKTPNLLVLDQKGTTGDPSFLEGSMYYNAFSQKFRCAEGSGPTWSDCVGGVTDLQTAYTNSTSPATITTSSATKNLKVVAGAVPTTDLFTIDSSSQAVTTAGVNALSVNYKGGAAAVEASAMRVDYVPGTTSGGTWSGLRIVAGATGPVSGVTAYGIKLEGPTSQGAGTETGLYVGTGWDIGMDVQSGGIQLAAQTDPSAPAAGNLRIYAKDIAGRILPKWIGPAGVDTPIQANFGFNRIAMMSPGGSTTVNTWGTTATNTGTLANPTPASTNLLTSVRRTTFSSGTTAGTVASHRQSVLQVWRGNASGLGGFFFTTRFGTSSLQSGNRAFIGLADSTAAPTNVDPTTSTTPGKIGMAINANTGNWNIVNNVTGTAPTSATLGANFPVNTTSLYELIIYCPPNGSTINYRVTNLSTGNQTTGSWSTNIPAATTFLAPQLWITNNATAASAIMDSAGWYLESDN